MAISTAAFPRLASETAAGDEAASERTAGQVLGVILYLVIPSTFGLIVVAGPLVALLFQRGAFDQASAAATSVALQVYAVGLLGMGATEILARLFYARQQARRPLIAAFAGMVVNAGLALALVGPFGSAGLAGAVSAASLVEAACLAVMIRSAGIRVDRGRPALADDSDARRVDRDGRAGLGGSGTDERFSRNEPARAADPGCGRPPRRCCGLPAVHHLGRPARGATSAPLGG